MKVPVLTYHSMRIDGNDYASNDHVAFSEDLRTIGALGFGVVSLADLVTRLSAEAAASKAMEKCVGLAFDDGPDFDFYDLPHPSWGMQRSMLGIMADAASAPHPAKLPAVHATSFVIVSPDARRALDRACMIGRDWWRDEWWAKAVRTGLLAIGNHSWDHNHPTLPGNDSGVRSKGTFTVVDDFRAAEYQIAQAAELLRAKAPNAGAGLFAYPYGEANDYLVREYFPLHGARLGIRAAFTSDPRPVTEGSDRWRLGRYVFGRDWGSSDELVRILRDG